MATVRIFRLERDGFGLFRSGAVDLAKQAIKNPDIRWGKSPSNHPGPFGDPGLKYRWDGMSALEAEKYFFGAKSLEILMRWVPHFRFRQEFQKIGVQVCVYEVDEAYVIHGDMQSVFRMDKATHVTRFPLLSARDMRKVQVCYAAAV